MIIGLRPKKEGGGTHIERSNLLSPADIAAHHAHAPSDARHGKNEELRIIRKLLRECQAEYDEYRAGNGHDHAIEQLAMAAAEEVGFNRAAADNVADIIRAERPGAVSPAAKIEVQGGR